MSLSNTPTVLDLLEEVPFLQHLPLDQLKTLATAGKIVSLPANSVIFEEGDTATELYLILEGSVCVQAHNTQGQQVPLSMLDAGQFFGELALAEQSTRSATVKTETACRLFSLSRTSFIQMLGQAPELLSEVMGAISQKIRSANTRYFQEQLQRQNLQFKLQHEQHQAIARLIAGMANEVHDPLTAARNLAADLEQGLKGNPLAETARALDSQIRQLQHLVEMFRAISAEEIQDKPEPVSWQELLDEFQEIYSMSSDRQLPIDITLTPEAAHATWWGIPGVLQTILMHLITNAELHAYPQSRGPIDILITLRGQAKERWFELSFSDQGEGMEAETLNQAHKPFFTTLRHQGCRGLGLAVVESLVNSALGGKLEIRSEAGRGTRVILRIPIQAPAAQL